MSPTFSLDGRCSFVRGVLVLTRPGVACKKMMGPCGACAAR